MGDHNRDALNHYAKWPVVTVTIYGWWCNQGLFQCRIFLWHSPSTQISGNVIDFIPLNIHFSQVCSNVGYDSKTHLRIKSREISFISSISTSISVISFFGDCTWRMGMMYHCRTQCEIWKQFENRDVIYGQIKLCEIWIKDGFWRDILHCNSIHVLVEFTVNHIQHVFNRYRNISCYTPIEWVDIDLH